MKVEQNNIPLDSHIRYAVDQEITKGNSLLVDLLAHAKTRPSSATQASTLSTSHLAALSLTKESSYSWTSFFPPINLNLDLAFSFKSFSSLEKARHKFSAFLSEKKKEKYKGEFVMKELFTCIEKLHTMFTIIESQRNGMKQG